MSLAARLARRIWWGKGPLPALARGTLLPAAATYRSLTAARNRLFDAGLLGSFAPVLPSIGVGNLAVGGTGKTPLVMYLAAELHSRGCRAGIVSRGYGNDEAREMAAAVPGAVIVVNRDRLAGALEARERGADLLLFDDCMQHRRLKPDLLLAVVAADTWHGNRWPLPAGPWREGLEALGRADAVVVTAKLAGAGAAGALAEALAGRTRRAVGIAVRIAVNGFRPLGGGALHGSDQMAGRSITLLAGIGEPELMAGQLEALGARVRLVDMGDHHAWSAGEVRAIVKRAEPGAAVVTSAKDAVKLRGLWPADGPECWVAEAGVAVTAGADALASLVDGVATAARHNNPWAAGAPAVREQ